ncbi:MAG: hypothetical protein RLN70_03125, partial [Rhodospirillaceae bacterium]
VNTDDTPRDRLFELMMRRFDVLNKHREGFRSIITATTRDPCGASVVACRLHHSLSSLLTAAGISTRGFIGLVRIKGLAAVGAYALRAWLKDDSADMAKTMAALDKALARAEAVANFSRGRSRS